MSILLSVLTSETSVGIEISKAVEPECDCCNYNKIAKPSFLSSKYRQAGRNSKNWTFVMKHVVNTTELISVKSTPVQKSQKPPVDSHFET